MANLYNRFCKWVKNNNSWTQMTWWKTNFNMPVTDIWDDTSSWSSWSWVFTYYWTATSFSLSWFNNGWEAIVWISWLHWSDLEWWNANHTFSQTWKDTLWATIFVNSATAFLQTPWVGSWLEYQLWSNQGVAPWEINWNWTYTCTVAVSWPNINLSTDDTFVITNYPWFTTYKTPWYMWVEWNNLSYVSANWFVHKINWTDLWDVSATPWYFWENSSISPYVNYIDTSWHKRTPPWNLEQFASTWSNWATSAISWQTPWYIYADNEFWLTHLSHIWYDWKKYLIWDAHDPYINPY